MMKKLLIGLFVIGITGITYLTVSVLSQQTTPLANADHVSSQTSEEQTTDHTSINEDEIDTTNEEQMKIIAQLPEQEQRALLGGFTVEEASRMWQETLESEKKLLQLISDVEAVLKKHHKKDVTIVYEYDRDMMQLLMDTLKTKKLEKQEIKAIKDYLYEWVVAIDENDPLAREVDDMLGLNDYAQSDTGSSSVE